MVCLLFEPDVAGAPAGVEQFPARFEADCVPGVAGGVAGGDGGAGRGVVVVYPCGRCILVWMIGWMGGWRGGRDAES